MFKLECVIVCDGYADFLAETIRHHRAMFDRLVVATSFEDLDTQRICEHWNVQCVKSDASESRKGVFRKGAAINEGLAKIDRDAWIVHLDADIVLPPQTRPLLEALKLDTGCIYGTDRFMVRNQRDWQKFLEMPRLQHENGSWLHLGAFELGTRVVIPSYGGWIPIGFFQMWHADSGVTQYPSGHADAAREDIQFALQWPRPKRAFLAEIVPYHLESEQAPMASNWSGRKTVPFTHDGTIRARVAPVAWQLRKRGQPDSPGALDSVS